MMLYKYKPYLIIDDLPEGYFQYLVLDLLGKSV